MSNSNQDTAKTQYPWFKFFPVIHVDREEQLSADLISRALIFDQLERHYQIVYGNKTGKFKSPKEVIIKKIEVLGGKCLVKNKKETYYTYAWDRAALSLFYPTKNHDSNISWKSGDHLLTQSLKDLEKELDSTPEPEGQVYVLVPCSTGITRTSIGLGSCPISRENYRPEVLTGYDQVVKDLKSKDPLGRLTIFSGPTGTGKTYLIRALLEDLPEVMFLLLPSSMTSTMSGPEILSALIEASETNKCDCPGCKPPNEDGDEDEVENYGDFLKPSSPPTFPGDKKIDLKHKKRTLALVIEDADSCLSSRASDNISAISAVLNLSDGIIGNCLDLRIIATTNQEFKNIDSALLRTGRLSAHVEVNLLDVGQAQRIYENLNGPPITWTKKFYALSDIYAMSKNQIPETLTTKPTIGFQK